MEEPNAPRRKDEDGADHQAGAPEKAELKLNLDLPSDEPLKRYLELNTQSTAEKFSCPKLDPVKYLAPRTSSIEPPADRVPIIASDEDEEDGMEEGDLEKDYPDEEEFDEDDEDYAEDFDEDDADQEDVEFDLPKRSLQSRFRMDRTSAHAGESSVSPESSAPIASEEKSGCSRILQELGRGDYYAAIGLKPDAARLTIESSAARLQTAYPKAAAALGEAVQILTDSDTREIYEIACRFRDHAVTKAVERYGDWVLEERYDGRAQAWSLITQLFRMEGGDSKIGPRAANSIAEYGLEWVIEWIVNQSAHHLKLSEDERKMGRAERSLQFSTCVRCHQTRRLSCNSCRGTGVSSGQSRFALVDCDLSGRGMSCAECDGGGTILCDCTDDWTFPVPPHAKTGYVIVGRGHRTGKDMPAVVEHPVYTERPASALTLLYSRYNAARQIGESNELFDLTLEEAAGEKRMPVPWQTAVTAILLSPFVGLILGLIEGVFTKSIWLTGLSGTLIGIPTALLSLTNMLIPKLGAKSRDLPPGLNRLLPVFMPLLGLVLSTILVYHTGLGWRGFIGAVLVTFCVLIFHFLMVKWSDELSKG